MNDTSIVATERSVPLTDEVTVELPSSLTAANVMEYYPRLQEALSEAKSIVLVGGGDEQTDAAGLQLIVAFAEEARRRDILWSWTKPGEAMHATAVLLGLHELLELAA